jgi:hypothetical protein
VATYPSNHAKNILNLRNIQNCGSFDIFGTYNSKEKNGTLANLRKCGNLNIFRTSINKEKFGSQTN